MLSSLALRSFIFHPNQWLVLKAARQASARPAYTQRPRCTPEFFATLPGGGKHFSRRFGALGGQSRNQAVTSPTGARAFVSGKEIMSLINQTALGIHETALADRLAHAKVFSPSGTGLLQSSRRTF
jgi:hypothetical protein